MALINHIDVQHDHKVAIAWDNTWVDLAGREVQWNEVSAWAIERFGLPGIKFTCRSTTKYLEFWFQDEADALIFQLKWS